MFRIGLKASLRSGCRRERSSRQACKVCHREKIRAQPATVGHPVMRIGQTLEPVPFVTHSWLDDAFLEIRRVFEKNEVCTVPKAASS